MTNKPPVSVETTPYFEDDVKQLRKRYPRIRQLLIDLMNILESGATPGDQVSGVGYTVYKMRLVNPDAQRGQSGGYRVIYYLKTREHIILITIYSKADQGDIPRKKITQLIQDYEQKHQR